MYIYLLGVILKTCICLIVAPENILFFYTLELEKRGVGCSRPERGYMTKTNIKESTTTEARTLPAARAFGKNGDVTQRCNTHESTSN